MSAHHNYHVSGTYGIRYGLQGFIPKYKHDVMELTPDNVRDIHEFGGTILSSSRGPQAPEEIVDALERMNISVLFMIGGDGTMKAASSVTREVLRRSLKISVIGIPKTIDNDINFVTRSFGFDTAVEKATEAIRCAHIEALGAPGASAWSSSWAGSRVSSRLRPAWPSRKSTSSLFPRPPSSCMVPKASWSSSKSA